MSFYEAVETNDRVPGFAPDLETRFFRRAVRRAAKLNAQRMLPTYRWGIVRDGRRWCVVAFQNRARSRGASPE